MIFHHIGLLVKDINTSIAEWQQFGFERKSEIFDISSQQVRLCFLNNFSDSAIELVEPYETNKSLQRLLKANIKFYHLAYTTDRFDELSKEFEEKGARQISTFNSEAFNNARCSFFLFPDSNLIELIDY